MSITLQVATSRIPLTDPSVTADPIVRDAFSEIERELGFGIVPNVFRAMAAQPVVLRAVWDLFRATVLQGLLPRGVKEMIGIVVSSANKSVYAQQVHLHSLSVQGVAASTLDALASGASEVPGLAPGLAAIVRIAHIAAYQGPLAVGDADVEAARAEGVTQEELVEVVSAINLFQYINSYTDLARIPVDAI